MGACLAVRAPPVVWQEGPRRAPLLQAQELMRGFVRTGATKKLVRGRGRAVTEGRVQPGARERPVPLAGAVRDAQGVAGLLQGQAGEVVQFDEFGLGGFFLRQPLEGLVQCQQVVVGGFPPAQRLAQADAVPPAAVLGPPFAPGLVEEDAAHGLGGRGKGVAAVLLAPVGVQAMVHPEAELAVARAARALGVPMVLSSVSSTPLEAVAAALGGSPRWFQLYWPKDPALAASLVGRAERAGFEAGVGTPDPHFLGWREP